MVASAVACKLTVNFSLSNPSGADDDNYASVFVEADAEGVQTPMPIFSCFTVSAGQTHEGSLSFASSDSIAPGTEVAFTAHVATLNDACLGVGTMSATVR